MISGETTREIANWFWSTKTSHIFDEIVPANHPSRMWINGKDERDQIESLVHVLARGGHLPLLVGALLRVRTHSRRQIDPSVMEAISNALVTGYGLRSEAEVTVDYTRDVFLCYAHEDAAQVDKICACLDKLNLSFFRDIVDITPGQSIAEHIIRAIHGCKAALVVVSDSFLESRWARQELSHIICRFGNNQSRLFTAALTDRVPEELQDIMAIDLRDIWSTEDFLSLVSRFGAVRNTLSEFGANDNRKLL